MVKVAETRLGERPPVPGAAMVYRVVPNRPFAEDVARRLWAASGFTIHGEVTIVAQYDTAHSHTMAMAWATREAI